MTESEVLKSIMNKLKTYELIGDIIWYSRLNSGKVKTQYNSWVQLCRIGTPDIVAIINCLNGKIAVLFIECKRTDVKKLRFEQQEFFNNMEGQPMIACVLINDPNQLGSAIKKAKQI